MNSNITTANSNNMMMRSSIVSSSFEKFFIEMENEQDSRALRSPFNRNQREQASSTRKPLLLTRACSKSHRSRQTNNNSNNNSNKTTTVTSINRSIRPAAVTVTSSNKNFYPLKNRNANNYLAFSKNQKALKRF